MLEGTEKRERDSVEMFHPCRGTKVGVNTFLYYIFKENFLLLTAPRNTNVLCNGTQKVALLTIKFLFWWKKYVHWASTIWFQKYNNFKTQQIPDKINNSKREFCVRILRLHHLWVYSTGGHCGWSEFFNNYSAARLVRWNQSRKLLW